MRIKEQLNPGYPVRIKKNTPGQSTTTARGGGFKKNQDKWDNFVLGLPIDSYFRTRTLDQYNIQQVFQALRSYEYEHVQERKEK